MEFMLWDYIGPIRHTVTNEEVRNAGRTIKPTIITVDTEFQYESTGPADWGAMITKLTEDKNRNELIKSTVNKNITNESSALILTDRIKHAEILCELLKEHNPVLLTGSMDKISREKAFTKVKNGCKLTIATTSLLGEGVDIPGWSDLFQVTPLGKSIRVQQTVGRIVRAKKGKTQARVFDFVDWNVPKLVRAYRERVLLYKQ
jgi:superfamily II DNA or RNA helicase